MMLAIAIANFYRISCGEIYCALRNLYSLLNILPPLHALVEPVKVLHKLFLDYLNDLDCPGHFHCMRGNVAHNMLNYFSWLVSSTNLLSCGNMEKPPNLPLTWRLPDPINETILKHQLCFYSSISILPAVIPLTWGEQDSLNAIHNLDYNFFIGIQCSVNPNKLDYQAMMNAIIYHLMQQKKVCFFG